MQDDIKKQVEQFVDKQLTQRVGKKLLKFYIDNYTHEGFYDNGSFQKWAQRKDKKNTNPILYKTGTMKQSFHVEYPEDGVIQVSNTAEYAKYHQEGTTKMPARPILYDDEKVRELIEEETLNELNEFITKIFNKK